ncbi:MAG: von Willebrand factor type A domain-containing protein [Myxococcales bacterium]|nr:von Willebrand factor type A domain-containing protein [Myxococcales bacterium]
MTVRWLAAGVVCLALGCAPKGQGEQADGAPQGQHVDRFRGEPPQDEDVGKRAPAVPRTAGPAGEAATAQEGSRARAEGQIAKKIEKMPSVGVHKALGSDLEAEPLMARDVAMQDAFGAGEGPMHNVLGAPNAKLGAAMSGVGDELAVGQGAGGLGLAGGTGTGGGGQGFGRIHGMGRIDTGGGRGLGALGTGGRMAQAFLPVPPPARERWAAREVKGFTPVAAQPLSTLSIDADTASYSLARSSLSQGRRPAPASVFVEDFINRFDYGDLPPTDGRPLRIVADVGAAPWAPAHRLVRVGVKAAEVSEADRAAANLVFLLDTSGSMRGPDRLALVQQGLLAMIEHLRADDRVAIVTYAGSAGLALPSTPAGDTATIQAALERLRSGGSTAGGAGIELAYRVAQDHFVKGGNNRVVLATDGDFNVGVQDQAGLVKLIEAKRKSGVLLTVLGVGRGNLRAQQMEAIAQHGDGGFHFLDGPQEARRVLVDELTQTLVTVARDVKVQVEFNPAQVKAWRVLGYENRTLAAQDFNDDQKDAGELQAGHTVTVLYELIPADSGEAVPGVDPLKYQPAATPSTAAEAGELLTVKVRAKRPTEAASTKWSVAVQDTDAAPSEALRWASAVAELALLLREDPHRGEASFPALIARAQGALGDDVFGTRAEFVALAQRAQALPPYAEPRLAQQAAQRAPKPQGHLRRGRTRVQGSCRAQDVEKVLRRRQRSLQYCYEKELARTPSLRGKVTLAWTINASGRVEQPRVQPGSLGSEVVTGCMARQVARWRFPRSADGGACQVQQPVLLTAG